MEILGQYLMMGAHNPTGIEFTKFLATSQNNKLRVYGVDGNILQLLYAPDDYAGFSFNWSQNGKYLSVAGGPWHIIYKRTGNSFSKVYSFVSGTQNTIGHAFSPNNNYIVKASKTVSGTGLSLTFGRMSSTTDQPDYFNSIISSTGAAFLTEESNCLSWAQDSSYVLTPRTSSSTGQTSFYTLTETGATYPTVAQNTTTAFSRMIATAISGVYLAAITADTSGAYFLRVVKYTAPSTITSLLSVQVGTVGSEIAKPISLSFTRDGVYLVVGRASYGSATERAYIVYKRSGDTFTDITASQGIALTGQGRQILFDPDGTKLYTLDYDPGQVVLTQATADIYTRSGDNLFNSETSNVVVSTDTTAMYGAIWPSPIYSS